MFELRVGLYYEIQNDIVLPHESTIIQLILEHKITVNGPLYFKTRARRPVLITTRLVIMCSLKSDLHVGTLL